MPKQYQCRRCGGFGHNARTCGKPAAQIGAFIPQTPSYSWTPKIGERVRVKDHPTDGSAYGPNFVGHEFEVRSLSQNGTYCQGSLPSPYDPTDIATYSVEKLEPVNIPFTEPENPAAANTSHAGTVLPPAGSEPEKFTFDSDKLRRLSCWEVAEAACKMHRIVLLYGPPGTGKTTLGNSTVRDGQPVYNLTLTEETPSSKLEGHWKPEGDEWKLHNGIGIRAWKEGARLVLNEVDKASMDTLQFLNGLLDDESIAALTLVDDSTVKPNPGFSVVATTNATPEDLPDSLRDRFSVAILIDEPHPNAIKSLPKDLQRAAKNSFKSGEVTFRNWKTFAELREKIGTEAAAKAVFGERAENILTTWVIGGN